MIVNIFIFHERFGRFVNCEHKKLLVLNPTHSRLSYKKDRTYSLFYIILKIASTLINFNRIFMFVIVCYVNHEEFILQIVKHKNEAKPTQQK